jgi:type III secretion protein L
MAPEADGKPAAPKLRPLGPIVRAAEAGIWTDAAAAIEEAERHAERMQDWAQTTYERERERGYREGLTVGAEEAARLIAATAARTETYMRDLERDLPRLVLELVERILGSFDPGQVLSLAVSQAVDKLRTGAEIRVHVSPDLADRLRASLADLARGSDAPRVRVHADPALASGTCVLHSEFGNVELGIEAQLKALKEGIESAWDDPDPGVEARSPRREAAP